VIKASDVMVGVDWILPLHLATPLPARVVAASGVKNMRRASQ
jgi:hypothetical protein